jgi:hypothetical protein
MAKLELGSRCPKGHFVYGHQALWQGEYLRCRVCWNTYQAGKARERREFKRQLSALLGPTVEPSV